jgi:hypothetical protein
MSTPNAIVVVDAVGDLGSAIGKAVAASGTVAAKLMAFVSALVPVAMVDVPALESVNYSALLAEVKALSPVDEAALLAALTTHLALPAGALVLADVVQGIDLAYQQEQLVLQFVAYGKKLKG